MQNKISKVLSKVRQCIFETRCRSALR